MKLSDFSDWLKTFYPPEQLPLFLDWLSAVNDEPEGRNALQALERFARNYAPNNRHDEDPMLWGWRWLILEALEGCRNAGRFYDGGDRNTIARESVSGYRKDLKELKGHLEGAIAILRRHNRNNNPLLAGHVTDLWLRDLPKRNIELYEEQDIIHRGPGVIDGNGVVHMAEGTSGRSSSLTSNTIITFFETFLDTLGSSPRFPSDWGAHRHVYGCLNFPDPRTDHYKKPVATDTMLAAYLVTLFSYYRQGLPSPLTGWTLVEKGCAEDHSLAASLINITLSLTKKEREKENEMENEEKEDSRAALGAKQIKDRLEKLLSRNPGVKVISW